jgi:hypothetical protein
MQEHREVAAHRAESRRQHRLWRDADDDIVTVGDSAAEKFVADDTTDLVDPRWLGKGRAIAFSASAPDGACSQRKFHDDFAVVHFTGFAKSEARIEIARSGPSGPKLSENFLVPGRPRAWPINSFSAAPPWP